MFVPLSAYHLVLAPYVKRDSGPSSVLCSTKAVAVAVAKAKLRELQM